MIASVHAGSSSKNPSQHLDHGDPVRRVRRLAAPRSPGLSRTSPPPGYRSGKRSPSYPSWMPKTPQPSSLEARTVPAMTALSPGTYPPRRS
jgi:hypothetical protein